MPGVKDFFREFYLKGKRAKLKNKDFSLISSDCNGGCILHDLHIRFNSPFVNMWIGASDYVKLCRSFKEYMEKDLEFIKLEGTECPVAKLGDVTIYFQHYHSEKEALEKWLERKARINYDNLFFLMNDRNGCTEELLKQFDELPYENKAVFVNKKYDNIKSAVLIKGFEKSDCVGRCMDYLNKICIFKYYDQFNYVEWFNRGA